MLPDASALAAVLLLGPTLLAAVIIRENEHLMTKRVLHQFRYRVAIEASTTFAAAVVYALGVPGEARWLLLMVFAVVSTATTGQTFRSYRHSQQLLKSQQSFTDTTG